MKAQRDKWQDLPHGGAMYSEDDRPVAVSDKGAWQLDESRILEDAQELSGIKLTWMHLNRAQRWDKVPITAVLRSRNKWNWCIAQVVPAACDLCSIEVGARWISEPGSLDRVWICETCAGRRAVN